MGEFEDNSKSKELLIQAKNELKIKENVNEKLKKKNEDLINNNINKKRISRKKITKFL